MSAFVPTKLPNDLHVLKQENDARCVESRIAELGPKRRCETSKPLHLCAALRNSSINPLLSQYFFYRPSGMW
jgi:hypothetical protein